MNHKTFSEFKIDFYKRVPDLSLFDCLDFNLIKVVLDGLKVDYVSRGLNVNKDFYKRKNLFYAKEFIKSILKNKRIPKVSKNKNVLLFGSVRYTQINNEYKSVYLDKLTKLYDRINCYIFMGENVIEKLDFDYSMKYVNQFSFMYSKHDSFLRNNLIKTIDKISNLDFNKSEIDNIKIAFYLFYKQYIFYKRFLDLTFFEICYVVCHYHNEGFLLAAKHKKLKTVELQHGIIANQDIFYNYPNRFKKIRDKAIFPDQILVFGNHWKKILEEGNCYKTNQIKIIGNFLTYNDEILQNEKKLFNKNQKYILITTQTKLSNFFVEYIKYLSGHLNKYNLDYKIIVKNHHSEELSLYSELKEIENILFSKSEVYSLFKIVEKHISIYSTTLYDAIMYKLENYSLNVPSCEDYVNKIVDSGVALKLEMTQTPFDTSKKIKKVRLKNFYSEFNPEVLFEF